MSSEYCRVACGKSGIVTRMSPYAPRVSTMPEMAALTPAADSVVACTIQRCSGKMPSESPKPARLSQNPAVSTAGSSVW